MDQLCELTAGNAIRESFSGHMTSERAYNERLHASLTRKAIKSKYRKGYVIFYGDGWTVKLRYTHPIPPISI